jgi:hypothetical protein
MCSYEDYDRSSLGMVYYIKNVQVAIFFDLNLPFFRAALALAIMTIIAIVE